MPKRWRPAKVSASQIGRHPADTRPTYQPFVDALVAAMRGETEARLVSVPAREVRIPPGYAAPPALIAEIAAGFEERRRTNEEMMTEIPVLEGSTGLLWAYDDTTLVALYHRFAPDATIICRIIGRDPNRK